MTLPVQTTPPFPPTQLVDRGGGVGCGWAGSWCCMCGWFLTHASFGQSGVCMKGGRHDACIYVGSALHQYTCPHVHTHIHNIGLDYIYI